MKLTIGRNEYNRMVEYALSLRPDEACGLIAGSIGEDGEKRIEKVYCLTNTDHTSEHFSIDPREQLASVKDMRKSGLVPLGNWHSHPETPSRPSEEDIRLAVDRNASYLILSLMDEAPVLNAFRIETDENIRYARKDELTITD